MNRLLHTVRAAQSGPAAQMRVGLNVERGAAAVEIPLLAAPHRPGFYLCGVTVLRALPQSGTTLYFLSYSDEGPMDALLAQTLSTSSPATNAAGVLVRSDGSAPLVVTSAPVNEPALMYVQPWVYGVVSS